VGIDDHETLLFVLVGSPDLVTHDTLQRGGPCLGTR
jgi:hypothetical protein